MKKISFLFLAILLSSCVQRANNWQRIPFEWPNGTDQFEHAYYLDVPVFEIQNDKLDEATALLKFVSYRKITPLEFASFTGEEKDSPLDAYLLRALSAKVEYGMDYNILKNEKNNLLVVCNSFPGLNDTLAASWAYSNTPIVILYDGKIKRVYIEYSIMNYL